MALWHSCHPVEPEEQGPGPIGNPTPTRYVLTSFMLVAGNSGGPIAEVSLTISGDTHVLSAAGWKGSPFDPCTYADIASKFRRYASNYLPTVAIDDIVEKVRYIEQIGDMADIARLLRGD